MAPQQQWLRLSSSAIFRDGWVRIGCYQIGRGGMGTVYLAERDDGQFEQQVAVKMVQPGMDTEFILARFRRERAGRCTLRIAYWHASACLS